MTRIFPGVTLTPARSISKDCVEVKSHAAGVAPDYLESGDSEVIIGTACVSMETFCEIVKYVLTNTDLDEDDPRHVLLAEIEASIIGDGLNPGQQRVVFM